MGMENIMKARDRLINVKRESAGHYAITAECRGKVVRGHITDSVLYDAYKSGSVTAADKLVVIAGRGKELN
jgi:hypothetical protein